MNPRYSTEVACVLAAAFALSVAHTVYAEVEGLADPDFTVRSPLTWGFYAVGFGTAALALRGERWAHWTVTALLVGFVGVSVLYYPTTFTPAQQTTFAWIENDVYVALLVVALYLQQLRLRRVSLNC